MTPGFAQFSTSSLKDAPWIATGGATGRLESLVLYVIVAIGGSWHHYLALGWSTKTNGDVRQVAFGLAAIFVAVVFYSPIKNGLDFAIGLNLFFCFVVTWFIYAGFHLSE